MITSDFQCAFQKKGVNREISVHCIWETLYALENELLLPLRKKEGCMYILFSGNREINVARGFGAWDLLLLRIYIQMWFESVLYWSEECIGQSRVIYECNLKWDLAWFIFKKKKNF